jgi:GTP-binding protein
MSLPTVAIVGRPNVGKSSLFNRFIRQRLAVVDSVSGVTRDRNYSTCDWNGVDFLLVDTGGMVPESKDMMERLTLDQADFAVHEADLVLFVVDTQTGIDKTDQMIARNLNKAQKNTILVANKADNDQMAMEVFDFLKLGLGDPFAVSATIGRGVGELLDELVARLPEPEPEREPEEGVIRVAVVGRPNSGKSSFINKLLGEDRHIVSPTAGTTRDAIDTPFEIDGRKYILVDTAGLRRKYKVTENIEFFTYLRAIRAIDGCDVAVILVDADAGLSTQDQHIISEVVKRRRAAVLAVNKWDLIEKDDRTADLFEKALKERIAMFSYLPVIFISALTGQRVTKVMDMVDRVYTEFTRQVPTSELNDLLQSAFARRKPPARKGKFIQIKYITQSEISPPTFIIFANHPDLIDKAYIGYLNNQLRARFGFEGVPIRLKFRRK